MRIKSDFKDYYDSFGNHPDILTYYRKTSRTSYFDKEARDEKSPYNIVKPHCRLSLSLPRNIEYLISTDICYTYGVVAFCSQFYFYLTLPKGHGRDSITEVYFYDGDAFLGHLQFLYPKEMASASITVLRSSLQRSFEIARKRTDQKCFDLL